MKKNVIYKLDAFFSQFKPIYYKKGEIILRADDPVFGVFLLKKGYVRQYVISKEGEELTIHVYRPISFFPAMLVISGYPNKYFYQTLSPVEVWRSPQDKVVEFLKREPEVLFDLASRFAAGLIGLSNRIEKLTLEGTSGKVASLIFYLASRFGKKEKRGILIQVPFTHKDIAAWLGMTRETVSRQLEKFKKGGLITYDNKYIIVRNPEKLKNLSQTPKRKVIENTPF